MKLNPLGKMILACSDNHRYAILKAVEKGNKTYKDIQSYTGITASMGFAYHLRKLKQLCIVQKSENNLTYSLTDKGNKMLKLLENSLGEKYINGDESEICSNTDDGHHDFMTICRKCSYVKKEQKAI